MNLVPCSACARHVRSTEPTCPFCSAVITASVARARRPRAGTSRAAILAFSSTVLVACGGGAEDESSRDRDSTGDEERAGSDPMDGSGSTGGDEGGRTGPQPGDEGTVVALYGAPAPEE